MIQIIKKYIFLIPILALFCCEDSIIQPIIENDEVTYVELNIGDVKQYYSPVENLHVSIEIVDTVPREDGEYIFKFKEIMYHDSLFYIESINFYDIKDGFFIQTDSTIDENNSQNPFNELYLAQVNPKAGDTFYRSQNGSSAYFLVSFLDSLYTPIQYFQNVYQYQLIDSDSTTSMAIYYAKKYGHIATKINLVGFPKTNWLYITYLKFKDEELGIYKNYNTSKVKIKNEQNFNIYGNKNKWRIW